MFKFYFLCIAVVALSCDGFFIRNSGKDRLSNWNAHMSEVTPYSNLYRELELFKQKLQNIGLGPDDEQATAVQNGENIKTMVSSQGNLKLFIKPSLPSSRESIKNLKLKPLILELILDLSEIIDKSDDNENEYKFGAMNLKKLVPKRRKTMVELISDIFRVPDGLDIGWFKEYQPYDNMQSSEESSKEDDKIVSHSINIEQIINPEKDFHFETEQLIKNIYNPHFNKNFVTDAHVDNDNNDREEIGNHFDNTDNSEEYHRIPEVPNIMRHSTKESGHHISKPTIIGYVDMSKENKSSVEYVATNSKEEEDDSSTSSFQISRRPNHNNVIIEDSSINWFEDVIGAPDEFPYNGEFKPSIKEDPEPEEEMLAVVEYKPQSTEDIMSEQFSSIVELLSESPFYETNDDDEIATIIEWQPDITSFYDSLEDNDEEDLNEEYPSIVAWEPTPSYKDTPNNEKDENQAQEEFPTNVGWVPMHTPDTNNGNFEEYPMFSGWVPTEKLVDTNTETELPPLEFPTIVGWVTKEPIENINEKIPAPNLFPKTTGWLHDLHKKNENNEKVLTKIHSSIEEKLENIIYGINHKLDNLVTNLVKLEDDKTIHTPNVLEEKEITTVVVETSSIIGTTTNSNIEIYSDGTAMQERLSTLEPKSTTIKEEFDTLTSDDQNFETKISDSHETNLHPEATTIQENESSIDSTTSKAELKTITSTDSSNNNFYETTFQYPITSSADSILINTIPVDQHVPPIAIDEIPDSQVHYIDLPTIIPPTYNQQYDDYAFMEDFDEDVATLEEIMKSNITYPSVESFPMESSIIEIIMKPNDDFAASKNSYEAEDTYHDKADQYETSEENITEIASESSSETTSTNNEFQIAADPTLNIEEEYVAVIEELIKQALNSYEDLESENNIKSDDDSSEREYNYSNYQIFSKNADIEKTELKNKDLDSDEEFVAVIEEIKVTSDEANKIDRIYEELEEILESSDESFEKDTNGSNELLNSGITTEETNTIDNNGATTEIYIESIQTILNYNSDQNERHANNSDDHSDDDDIENELQLPEINIQLIIDGIPDDLNDFKESIIIKPTFDTKNDQAYVHKITEELTAIPINGTISLYTTTQHSVTSENIIPTTESKIDMEFFKTSEAKNSNYFKSNETSNNKPVSNRIETTTNGLTTNYEEELTTVLQELIESNTTRDNGETSNHHKLTLTESSLTEYNLISTEPPSMESYSTEHDDRLIFEDDPILNEDVLDYEDLKKLYNANDNRLIFEDDPLLENDVDVINITSTEKPHHQLKFPTESEMNDSSVTIKSPSISGFTTTILKTTTPQTIPQYIIKNTDINDYHANYTEKNSNQITAAIKDGNPSLVQSFLEISEITKNANKEIPDELHILNNDLPIFYQINLNDNSHDTENVKTEIEVDLTKDDDEQSTEIPDIRDMNIDLPIYYEINLDDININENSSDTDNVEIEIEIDPSKIDEKQLENLQLTLFDIEDSNVATEQTTVIAEELRDLNDFEPIYYEINLDDININENSSDTDNVEIEIEIDPSKVDEKQLENLQLTLFDIEDSNVATEQLSSSSNSANEQGEESERAFNANDPKYTYQSFQEFNDHFNERSDIPISYSDFPLIEYDDEDNERAELTPHFDEIEVLNMIPIIIEQMKLGKVTESEKQTLSGIFGDLWTIIDDEVNRSADDEMNPILASLLQSHILRMKKREVNRDFTNDINGNSIKTIKIHETDSVPLRININVEETLPPSQRILRTAAAAIHGSKLRKKYGHQRRKHEQRRKMNIHRRKYPQVRRVKKSPTFDIVESHEPFDMHKHEDTSYEMEIPTVTELIELARLHKLRRKKMRDSEIKQDISGNNRFQFHEFVGLNDYYGDDSSEEFDDYFHDYE